jgi:putative oxidoreductase
VQLIVSSARSGNKLADSRDYEGMNTSLAAAARSSAKTLRSSGSKASNQPSFTKWAAIPLRLISGYGFMAHGYAKLSRGPDAFANILQAIGVPAPHLMAWSTISVELLGGFAILLGAFVKLASIPMTAVLLVAMFKVHLSYGFSSIKLLAVTPAGARFGPPGYETNLLYVACLAALVLGGTGPLAIDGLLRDPAKDANSK